MEILIASHNKKKAFELESILGKYGIKVITFSDIGYNNEIEETGKTFEENSYIKAKVARDLGYISIADDSGLCVDALNGAPGVFSARYSGEDCDSEKNNDKLLSELENVDMKERTAKFVSVITCIIPGNEDDVIVARGECPGIIIKERRGKSGFGYDPLFYYEPYKKTFAEMSNEEKNKISHRGRALEDFMKKFEPKINELRKTNDNK